MLSASCVPTTSRQSPAADVREPQYLGIPLAAGALTRVIVLTTLDRRKQAIFFRLFGPVALIGLLYVIIVLFANQARPIVDHIGTVFRICVPCVRCRLLRAAA